MDLFSGWSSSLVPPKKGITTSANDNPLLLLQQQRAFMTSQSSSPAERARNASLQFSNQSHIVNQSYTDQAFDQVDHGDASHQPAVLEKNAWAQNRCLLCLLYEEKLRVLQRKVDELTNSSHVAGVRNDDQQKKDQKASSSSSSSHHQHHHVTHSTIIMNDPKQFLKIVADKDHEIGELQKDLKHLAIDRDNVRAALDDTQMRLEVAMRMLQEIEDGKNDDDDEHQKHEEQEGGSHNNSNNNRNHARRSNSLGITRLGQPSLAHIASSSRSASAVASRSGTPLPHNYSARDPVHNEMVVNVLGLSQVEKQKQNRGNNNNNSRRHDNENDDTTIMFGTSNAAMTLSGVSPLIGVASTKQQTKSDHEQRVKLSEELTARRQARNTTNSPIKNRDQQEQEQEQNRRKNTGQMKLTRNLADESLGIWLPSEPTHEVPSSLSRLGPLPHPSSLRSVTIALPSEQSWKKGGQKPTLIDLNAKGTPSKGGSSSNSNNNKVSAVMSLRNVMMAAATPNHNQNSSATQRSISAVQTGNHHQVSPPPPTSSTSILKDYASHSPHFQIFGPH